MSYGTTTESVNPEKGPSGANSPQGTQNNKSSLIDLLQLVADNLRLLVFGSLGGGVLALAIAFVIAPTFTAKVQFIPPKQQQSSAAAALSDLGALGGAAGAIAGIKNPADQYAAMVKSTSIADALIAKFKLAERYNLEYEEDIRKQLSKKTNVMVGAKDGLISIEVDDHNPQMAADMANAYIIELRALLNRLALTESHQRRVFYERMVQTAKDNMVKAEQALKASRVDSAALKASPLASLEGVARLKAQISVQEVRLAGMRGYLAITAPEFEQALTELAALRSQLARSELAEGPAFSKSDYVARYREFKYQEALFGLYMRQFELASADESREGAVVQVIDIAHAPHRKSKPKKVLVAIIATLATGLLLLLFILSRNALNTAAQDPVYAAKLKRLRQSLAHAMNRK